jgi:hypothetical protein
MQASTRRRSRRALAVAGRQRRPARRPAENDQVGSGDAAGIVDDVDRGDLRAGDREHSKSDRPAVRGGDHADGSVYQRRQGQLSESREAGRASGHRHRPANRLGAVGTHHDLWIERLQQRLEVATARSGKEGIND